MSALNRVLDYHKASKHHLNAFARGPGRLDWANQPDPFRRYSGAPLVKLDRRMMFSDAEKLVPLNVSSISQLFFNSLALSALKSLAGSIWALRVNPSSGNLHPTEGYLITGPVDGLAQSPGVFHYAPASTLSS